MRRSHRPSSSVLSRQSALKNIFDLKTLKHQYKDRGHPLRGPRTTQRERERHTHTERHPQTVICTFKGACMCRLYELRNAEGERVVHVHTPRKSNLLLRL